MTNSEHINQLRKEAEQIGKRANSAERGYILGWRKAHIQAVKKVLDAEIERKNNG